MYLKNTDVFTKCITMHLQNAQNTFNISLKVPLKIHPFLS